MSTETKEQSHSEQQAWAQLSSICEMVAKLTREGAASEYVKELSREQCTKLMSDNGTYALPDETDDEVRAHLAELISDETIEPDDFEFDEEAAREEIQQDPLSVQVRSGWHNPGETGTAEEFEILLCTGGPAVRIRGELDSGLQPDRAWIEHQDWGTPWTQIFGLDSYQQEALLTYCQQFFFGE